MRNVLPRRHGCNGTEGWGGSKRQCANSDEQQHVCGSVRLVGGERRSPGKPQLEVNIPDCYADSRFDQSFDVQTGSAFVGSFKNSLVHLPTVIDLINSSG